jgi:hypothetical protein
LVLAVPPRPAQAETINCTAITAVPFTITAAGVYCLTQDIGTNLASGAAITIAANNVVLDLNGHRLGNLAGRGTQALGIWASQQTNFTIKNGTVGGFLYGIYLGDSSPYTTSRGHVIEDLRADQNTYLAIQVAGRGNIVRNTRVVATGGSTAFGANVAAYGIVVDGPETRVLNNDVIGTFGTGTGASVGIMVHDLGSNNLAVNNRITQALYGIYYFNGTGKFRDNLTSGVTYPFVGGTDAGNNN